MAVQRTVLFLSIYLTAMLTLMESNPQFFFEVMAGHESEFDEWLRGLETLSFVV